MKLKYILAAGVVALLAGCDESRFLDTKPFRVGTSIISQRENILRLQIYTQIRKTCFLNPLIECLECV